MSVSRFDKDAPPGQKSDSQSASFNSQSAAWRYGSALLLVALATLLKALLYNLIGLERTHIPFALFYAAVVIVTFYCGFGPGILSALISGLLGAYLFMPPIYSLDIGLHGWLQVGVFTVTALLISYLGDRSRRAEKEAEERREWLLTTLRSIGDAVIATDREGRISFMNGVAQELMGWREAEVQGRRLAEIFHILSEQSREQIEDPVALVLERGTVIGMANHTVLITRDGQEVPIEDSAAPIVDGAGNTIGVVLVFHDVSEARRAEEEKARLAAQVEAERERLRNLVGNVPGVVWEAWGDPEASSQRIDFVSDYVKQMLGYTVEEWLRTPNFWLTVVHPEDRERAAAEAHAIFKSCRGGVSRFRWVARDGRIIHVEAQSMVICDSEGRPVGMRGVTMDITERKRAEEALDALLVREREVRTAAEESERRYRYLADSMPQIVWTARPDGWFDYYNRRWYEYTGMTAEQTLGWGWQPVLHPDDVENCLRRWATAVERGESYEIEYRFRRASDGSYRWHLGRAVPMRDAEGRILKWFGTCTDIDDQKRAVEKLRFLAEASELLAESNDYNATLERVARLATRSVADWCTIDIIEEDRTIHRITTHADPSREEAAREMNRRYPPVRGLPCGPSNVINTARPEIYTEMTDELFRSVARNDEHYRMLRALGIESSLCAPLVARGRILGAISLAMAGSGRRYTQADLPFIEDVAHRVALAVDNARLFRRTEEANRTKDEFLATLSHELRTPLTPIIGWTHMLRSGRLPASETPHGLAVIDKNSQALTRLINDLLDMSAIMSGKMRIEHLPIALDAVLTEAVETVRAEADKRRVRIELKGVTRPEDGDGAPLMVSGDRTRLVQVFWNLLNNAVKFSAEGGRVRVVCERRATEARIRVEDDGQGIPTEFLPHVFERFRQADQATTRAHGGLGIGLALVKSFVEAHGGTARAESSGPGHGSRFTITLPLIQAESAGLEAGDAGLVEAPARDAEGGRRVLLIEDALDTLEMLQTVFEGRGFETVTCETPAEALRVASGLWFDIIVSDIGLPHIDGYELLKRLRQLPHLRHTPAVALTGYAAQKDVEAALLAGYDMHIPKPVDPTVLADAIEKIIEQKLSEQDVSQG